jgi:hypothetical protein
VHGQVGVREPQPVKSVVSLSERKGCGSRGEFETLLPPTFLIPISRIRSLMSCGNQDGKRTWDTPLRKPWNPVIKACLNAIDEHIRLYVETRDVWHLRQAEYLRDYVVRLKDWIHEQEGKSH